MITLLTFHFIHLFQEKCVRHKCIYVKRSCHRAEIFRGGLKLFGTEFNPP